jgi:hypothetical protein
MLKKGQIIRLVNDYIGVNGGYLGDFSYRTHQDFYPCYCELDIDPTNYQGTTRERFISILSQAAPQDQAKIIRGTFKKYPCDQGSEKDLKRKSIYIELCDLAGRLEKSEVAVKAHNFSDKSVVFNALQDAEVLLSERGAISALDRVHTAIHGFLKSQCEQSGIQVSRDANIIECFKSLRTSHPSFQISGEYDQEVKKVLNALSAVLDALNTLRNRASLAHPSANILDDAASHLMINSAKTLLRYVSDRIERGKDDCIIKPELQMTGTDDDLPF